MDKVDLTILGATEAEIAPLAALETSQTMRLAGRSFRVCIHGTLRLLIGVTGMGKVNAAATTAAALSIFASGEVWNVGCAGAYPGSGLGLGDVLVSEECLCADEGILTKDGPAPASALGIPLVLKNGRPYCDSFPLGEYLRGGKLRDLLPEGLYGPGHSGAEPLGRGAPSAGFQLRYGPSLTVGMTSADAQTASSRFNRFGALAENMEGSAIAQTCLLFDVPFLELRGVSNMAGDRQKTHWDLPAAVDHCLSVVRRLLDHRPQQSLEPISLDRGGN